MGKPIQNPTKKLTTMMGAKGARLFSKNAAKHCRKARQGIFCEVDMKRSLQERSALGSILIVFCM